MSEPVYVGIDVGTQSVRVMAVTELGRVIASASRPLGSMREGVRHEQDPQAWWSATVEALREVTAACGSALRVLGLAVDATSGTILLVDGTGTPLTRGLMYDDGRARAEAQEADEVGRSLWTAMSYRMQPSWALAKLMWLQRNGHMAAGAKLLHQNDWINLRLAGRRLATDSSNALKTGYNLLSMEWPLSVMEALEIPPAVLPEVVAPGSYIGEVSPEAAALTGLPPKTPIVAGMTDGCAAQLASGATSVGSWNTVIGTTLVVKGATEQLLRDPLGAVYSHRSMDRLWLPGGASSTGAGAIAQGFDAAALPALNAYAERHGPTPLVVYPLTGTGERFPFLAPDAHGFSLGEPASTEERFRGTLQGIALWERLSFDALRALGAPTHGTFTISGGATRSWALNQFRADVMERELRIAEVTEGAFGMALLASAAASSLAEATARMVHTGTAIAPSRPFEQYAGAYEQLVRALYQRGWLPDSLLQAAGFGSHT